MTKQLRHPCAVFCVTASGESCVEFMCVARDEDDAMRQFISENGPFDYAEYEWTLHQASSWGSRAWCEGYLEAMYDSNDIDDDAHEEPEQSRGAPSSVSDLTIDELREWIADMSVFRAGIPTGRKVCDLLAEWHPEQHDPPGISGAWMFSSLGQLRTELLDVYAGKVKP